MFYAKRKYFYLENCDIKLGKIEEIPQFIKTMNDELNTIFQEYHLERFTDEGIDLQYKADPGFQMHKEKWINDAKNQWNHYSNPELIHHYQSYAEYFIDNCNQHGIEPTYKGFRDYLMYLESVRLKEGVQ